MVDNIVRPREIRQLSVKQRKTKGLTNVKQKGKNKRQKIKEIYGQCQRQLKTMTGKFCSN